MATNRIDTEPNFLYPDPNIIRSKLGWDDVDLLENLFSNVIPSFEFSVTDFKNPTVRYSAPINPQFTFNVITGLNKSETSNNEILTSFDFSIQAADNIVETYTKSITPDFEFTIITGSDGSSSTTHNINTSFTYDIVQVTQENFISSSQKNVNPSFTYNISANVCAAAGTVLNTYCVGFDLYETRADGNCGTTEVLVAVNSTQCGYTPPPPPPKTATPGTGTRTDLTTASSVTFSITNNDSSSANITWEIREGSEFGTIRNSGTSSVGGFNGTTVSATGLSASTTYFLTNVVATASGKTASDPGIVRNITTSAAPPPPVPVSPSNVSFDISDNHCNYHYVNLTNSNNFSVTVEVRRAGQTWQTLANVGANFSGLILTPIVDSGSGPFASRTYEVRFTSTGGTSSGVSYTISYTTCSTNQGLIPGGGVNV
jgi:hypothetical protein